jgi:hypothetical protein
MASDVPPMQSPAIRRRQEFVASSLHPGEQKMSDRPNLILRGVALVSINHVVMQDKFIKLVHIGTICRDSEKRTEVRQRDLCPDSKSVFAVDEINRSYRLLKSSLRITISIPVAEGKNLHPWRRPAADQ